MSETITANRRIAKNTILLYVRMFFVMIVSLITVRVLLQKIGVQDYGIYNAVAGFVTTLAFISSVLSVASQRYFSFYIGKGDIIALRKVFSIIIICYIIVALLIFFLGETIGLWFVNHKMVYPPERQYAVMWVYQFAILSCICSIMCSPFQAIVISYEDMNIYACIGIVEVLMKLGIIFLLTFLSVDKLILYSILHCSIFIVILITYLAIVKRKYKNIRFVLHWDKKGFMEIFSYSFWSMFGSVAGLANTQGTNILLNLFFGPIANAAYSISSQVSAAISQFANSFYTAVRPAIIKSYAQNQLDQLNYLFYLSCKVLFTLSFLLLLPIACETNTILNLWLDIVTEEMVVFTRLSILYTFLLIISNPITAIVQAANKVKSYHLVVDSFTLLSLPVSYVLFRLSFPSFTAYLVTITFFSIAHLLRLFILKKIMRFSIMYYFISFVIPAVLTVVLSYVFSQFFTPDLGSPILNLVCKCFYDSLLIICVCGLLVFSKAERNEVVGLIVNKIRNKR